MKDLSALGCGGGVGYCLGKGTHMLTPLPQLDLPRKAPSRPDLSLDWLAGPQAQSLAQSPLPSCAACLAAGRGAEPPLNRKAEQLRGKLAGKASEGSGWEWEQSRKQGLSGRHAGPASWFLSAYQRQAVMSPRWELTSGPTGGLGKGLKCRSVLPIHHCPCAGGQWSGAQRMPPWCH